MKPDFTDKELKHMAFCKDMECLFCGFAGRILHNDEKYEPRMSKELKAVISPRKVKKKKHTKWTPELDTKLLNLRSQGFTFDEIATQMDMSKPTVFFRIKKLTQEK